MSETATGVDRTSRALLALLDLSKALSSQVDLDALLQVFVEKVSSVIDAERTSIFVYDAARDMLWTRLAQGLDDTRIELRRGAGIAGEVARTLRPATIADAYSDSRFNADIDRRLGFRTRNVIAAPIVDSSGNLLGVVESVNKIGGATFDEQDELLIAAIASHVAVAMERATLTAARLENERLSEALKVASEIQRQMLPRPIEPGERFELHAHLRPAKLVGGDLYDYAIDGDRLYFLIGDVAGKGVGAALVMAQAKTLFRANVPHCGDAAKLTEAVNIRLCEETGATMFVTAFCGFLDLSDGTLQFCNAGHDRPFMLRSGGAELLHSTPGLALGVMPHFKYSLQESRLDHGDALFLYTDGVTEATNAADELFTIERLHDVLAAKSSESVERIVGAVLEANEAFAGHAPQADDVTMLCVRYR